MNSTIEQRKPRIVGACRPMAEWSDEELLLHYRAKGERRAFEELVHRYERELYNYLRHYLGDAQMAEDAFQTTFLQVFLKVEQFEPGRKVRPWLYTIATNQAIDAQRRNRRHRAASLSRGTEDADVQWSAHLAEPEQSQQRLDPSEYIEASEQSRCIREAVDRLPEPLREVLVLVYYQGLKYREAAEVLSIPVGTVKSRLHTAIRKLEHAIQHTRHSPPGHG